MGQPHRRLWDERLKSLPFIAKSTGTAMFLAYKTTQFGNWVDKEQYKVAPRRKDVVYDHLPNSEWNLGFRMGHLAVWDERLSELGDYRKIHGQLFLKIRVAK
jgi:hypothetical protein